MLGPVSIVLFSLVTFTWNLTPVHGGYVITIPRRWTLNETTQVCVSLTEASVFGADDALQAAISVHVGNFSKVLSEQSLKFTTGESNDCTELDIPAETGTISEPVHNEIMSLSLKGFVAGNEIAENLNVTFVNRDSKTFIQTDKYLYKPGQTVQFRILTVGGPFLNVSTEPIDLIYVETPKGTKIQQWRNVSNSGGLVHLSFKLSDEVDEGIYQILVSKSVKNKESYTEYQHFSVEDYVLPKYEVTIKPSAVIYGNDKNFTIKLCAKYTFGEPVRGLANLTISAGSWRVYASESQTKNISGCEDFTFSTEKLHFDSNNCHIRVNQLKAEAVVVEEGTGVEITGGNYNIRIKRQIITFNDQSPNIIEKPYMPKFIKIAATYADGTQAKDELMEVCTYFKEENICKNFTTSHQGYLTFITRANSNNRIEVKAVNYPRIERNWNDVMSASNYYQYQHSTRKYLDPSNSSLTIDQGTPLECHNGGSVGATIKVIYFVKGTPSADVHVQVISRGQVQYLSKMKVDFVPGDVSYKNVDVLIEPKPVPESHTQGTFDVPISLPATVSPKLQLLVWFTLPDGVVVADTREIDVSNCLPHQVDMSWSTPKAEPGTDATFSVTGAKSSLCSVGVVDKSVELLSKENRKHLQLDDILNNIYPYQVNNWDKGQLTLEYCLAKYNGSLDEANRQLSAISEDEKLIYDGYKQRPDQYIYIENQESEALHMFIKAGYFVLTDLKVQRQFCYKKITDAIKAEEREKDRISSAVAFSSEPQRAPPRQSSGHANRIANYPAPQIVMDTDFAAVERGSASFDDPPQSIAEQEQTRSYLPETWLWNLVTLSTEGGISESVTLPDGITEWVGRAVCVHPTKGLGFSNQSSITTFTHFFTDLTLPANIQRGEVLPLKVSVFNYLEEPLPVKLVLSPSSGYKTMPGVQNERSICISPKSKSVETINMTFLELGDINITVEATVDPIASPSCGSGTPVIIKTDRLIKSLPVEAEGILRQKTYSKYVCAEDIADKTAVADSWMIETPAEFVEGSDRAWVTVSGDLMAPMINNIGRIVSLPSGCGEQNMVNFAPNVYTKQYLEASNQLTHETEERIDFFLKQGYQRQLRYRHSSNGSFSTFGTRDSSGSTWLTAFVLKSFDQAIPLIYIDEEIVKSALNYLQSQQNNVTGCFNSQGRVVHKMLQGGIDKSGNGDVLHSAYILGALGSMSGKVVPDPNVISSGIKCIETDTSIHPYSLALRAYSLAKSNATNAKKVIDQLLALAVTTESEIFWSLPEGEKNSALQVETAAYALLAMIDQDSKAYVEQSRKIVRWISGKRNSYGGFISTQDTVVALEALAAFQKVLPSTEQQTVIKVHSGDFKQQFDVLKTNKLVQQSADLPLVPANMELFVDGKGCALVQSVLRYNVLADSPSSAFTLKVEATESGSDCRARHVSACVSYTLSDLASNMALVEFKLQTGYYADKDQLEDVLISDKTDTIKRYEIDGSKVVFYIDEVKATEICLGFKVHQDVEIDNIKPGYVKVYDYYQPEYETSKTYAFPAPLLCNAVN